MSVLYFLAQTLRIAIPYLFAAAGGTLAERAGVVSLTLEGFLLGGAFGAVLGAHFGDSAWLGIGAAIASGLALGGLSALAAVRFRADQIVAGVALNLFVAGLARFLLQLFFGSSSNSPRVAGFEGASAADLAANPLVWLGLAALPLVGFVLAQTRFGLRVRAAGEHPEAARSVGVPVARVRTLAVLASGVLAALGGAFLVLDQHQFTDGMSGGRGFIALAAVIFGRWQPLRAGIACLFFAAAETLQIQLQTLHWLPSQLVAAIPYLLTIVALVGLVGRSVAPSALGRAEE